MIYFLKHKKNDISLIAKSRKWWIRSQVMSLLFLKLQIRLEWFFWDEIFISLAGREPTLGCKAVSENSLMTMKVCICKHRWSTACLVLMQHACHTRIDVSNKACGPNGIQLLFGCSSEAKNIMYILQWLREIEIKRIVIYESYITSKFQDL